MDVIPFRRYPESNKLELRNYFMSSACKRTGYKTKRLHRYVWEKHNGEIPKGMHVHHIDGDTTNNEISNLEIVTSMEHSKKHYAENLPKWRRNMDIARIAAIEWHKSEAGREFHKRLGKLSWTNKQWHPATCQQCGKGYTTPYPERSKFCGNNCKASALRARRRLLNRHD